MTCAPLRGGYLRTHATPIPVPPGFDAVIMSRKPWSHWTGGTPRICFRSPFQLCEADEQGDFMRVRFCNPASSERPLQLIAAIDWPMSTWWTQWALALDWRSA